MQDTKIINTKIIYYVKYSKIIKSSNEIKY